MSSPARTIPYSSTLPPHLEKIGRALVGGNLPSITKAVFAHDEIRNLLLLRFFDLIDKECAELCRKNPGTISRFRNIPVDKLVQFKWNDVIDDMRSKSPTLLQVFSTVVSHNDHRNTSKKGDQQHNPSICMATAVLLKERNREMCGVQLVISIALYLSRVQKKVSNYQYS